MESPRVQFNPTDPSTYFITNKESLTPKRPQTMTRSYPYLIHEPLIEFPMKPSNETDPLLIDESTEVSDASFAEISFSGVDIFQLLDQDTKSLSSTPNQPSEELVKVKEDPDGSIHIKEEPTELNRSLNRSGREILAEALNTVTFLCPKCRYRSPSKEDVLQHFTTTHIRYIERPCNQCSFIGRSKRNLANHKKETHPRLGRASKHNFLTLPTGEFKCHKCKFRSFYRITLIRHIAMHEGEKKFTCDKCPYQTMQKTPMVFHQRRHMDLPNPEKYPFKCHHCGLAEKSQECLSNHLAWHGEGQMYNCDLCPFVTSFKPSLHSHVKLCHGISRKKYERRQLPTRKPGQEGEVPETEEPAIRKKRPYTYKNKGPYTGKKRGRKPKNRESESYQSLVNSKKTDTEKEESASENKSESGKDFTDESVDEEDIYIPHGHSRFRPERRELRRSARTTRKSSTNVDDTNYSRAAKININYSLEKINDIQTGKRQRGRPRKGITDFNLDCEPTEKLQRIGDNQSSLSNLSYEPAVDTSTPKEEDTLLNKQLDTTDPNQRVTQASGSAPHTPIEAQEFNYEKLQEDEERKALEEQGVELSNQNSEGTSSMVNKALEELDSLKGNKLLKADDNLECQNQSSSENQSDDSSSSSSSSEDSDDSDSSSDEDESSDTSLEASTRVGSIPQVSNALENEETSQILCEVNESHNSIPPILPSHNNESSNESDTLIQQNSPTFKKNQDIADEYSDDTHLQDSINQDTISTPLPQENGMIHRNSPQQNPESNLGKSDNEEFKKKE